MQTFHTTWDYKIKVTSINKRYEWDIRNSLDCHNKGDKDLSWDDISQSCVWLMKITEPLWFLYRGAGAVKKRLSNTFYGML